MGAIENETVTITLTDLNGRVVAMRNYGNLNGELILPIDLTGVAKGLYTVVITKGEQTTVKKLMVQ